MKTEIFILFILFILMICAAIINIKAIENRKNIKKYNQLCIDDMKNLVKELQKLNISEDNRRKIRVKKQRED